MTNYILLSRMMASALRRYARREDGSGRRLAFVPCWSSARMCNLGGCNLSDVLPKDDA